MLFALNCKDRPGKLQLRIDTRPEHVTHLNDLNAKGVLKFAGPYLDGDEKPCGTLAVIEAADAAAAKAIADSDPYAKAGLFESVDIKRWNWVFNNPASK